MARVATGTGGATTRRRWRVRGISITGYRHLQDGIQCQDAYHQQVLAPDGPVVLAVADGAGSRPRAAEGATIAVGISVEVFKKALAGGVPPDPKAWHHLLRTGYDEVRRQFERTTSQIGGRSRPEDFGTTLTVAVLAGPWVGIARLGDGLVIVAVPGEGDGDDLHLVSVASNSGEFANETEFLTSGNAADAVQIDCLYDPQLKAVILATDGIAPLGILGRTGRFPKVNAQFFARVLPYLLPADGDPNVVATLLQGDKVTSLSGDDKTLLAAVRE
jgi:hypothetical protein